MIKRPLSLSHEAQLSRLKKTEEGRASRIKKRLLQGLKIGVSGLETVASAAGPIPGIVASIGASIGNSFIEGAVSQLENEGVEPDFGKSGAHLIFEIAQEGAVRSKEVWPIWNRLLLNAMDPTFDHGIRSEDILLLKSLNPSDCILVYILGNFGDMLNEKVRSTEGIDDYIEMFPVKNKNCIKNDGFYLNDIKNIFRTVFCSPLTVPDSELEHSLISRSSTTLMAYQDRQLKLESHPPIFELNCILESQYFYIEDKTHRVNHSPFSKEINGIIAARLTHRAQRLSHLLLRASDKKQ